MFCVSYCCANLRVDKKKAVLGDKAGRNVKMLGGKGRYGLEIIRIKGENG